MEAEQIYPPHATFNVNTVANIKFLSACFTGAIAGVLGLEKQYGFALFALSSLVTAVFIYLAHMPKARSVSRGGSSGVRLYVPGGSWELVNPGQENVFSFVLLWTLFFGLVHVYD
ncbi:hypothetical protein DL93DRAFT_2165149 [Clavulina sp. PMI_390]|nr:hypothetical protein DL93DRAFT_2165149 [Clavulina sp. PMI_390]